MKSQKKQAPTTMGFLAMVLALSPVTVTGFSGTGAVDVSSSGTGSRTFPHSSVVRTAVRRGSISSSHTRLNYITDRSSAISDPNNDQEQLTQQSQQWWNSIFGSRAENNAADEYLEFLDKRYNRILQDEQPSPKKKEPHGISVLHWLYQNDPEAQQHKQGKDDALYVLGVANLASKKLLQKHQLMPEENTLKDTVDAQAVTTSTDVESAPVARMSNLFRQVAQKREVFLRRQVRYTRMAMALVLRQVLTAPIKAVRKLYALGGGGKSFAWTLTALGALTFLLRPAALLAVRDSTGASLAA